MPRQPKWPPSILVHRRSGQARIRVRGKDYYLGRAGSPEAKREYARLVLELAERGEAGPTRAPADLPACRVIVEAVNRFLEHARKSYTRRGGQVTRFEQALSVLIERHGNTPLSAFGAEQLTEAREAMCARGWCATTVNRHIIRIRTAWRWLEEKAKVAPAGSWAALSVVGPLLGNHPLYKAPPKRAKTTDMEEVRLVCRHLPLVVRSMLLVQFWTGMRTGELVIMQRGDVVLGEDGSGTYTPRRHKNDWRGEGHERVVALGPRAVAALAPWLASCASPGDYVFPALPCRRRTTEGRPIEPPPDAYDRCRGYTVYSYAQAVRRAADRAGLPHFHCYLCRHATRMRVSKAEGDEAARAVLGQKHLGTAINYGEIDRGLAREAVRRLG